MSNFKLIVIIASLSLLFVESASAQPGWRYRRGYYYGPPVYAYPPVVVAPPPAIVAPPPPIVVAPPQPAYIAPAPYAPYYAPPAYTYGVVGPRGRFGVGYATPGFGVYFGR